MAEFWTEYGDSLTTLGLYAAGITAYTLVVTWLYMPMGTRLMFAKRFGEKAVATPGRRFLYVLLFPLVSFGFFLVVALTLFAFNSEAVAGASSLDLTPEKILIISMGMVLAIRVAAYFHESGAQELAKVMPLGLLGLFLVTGRVDGIAQVLENMTALLDHLDLVGIFFAVIVVVEFLLRGIYELAGRPGRRPVKGTPAAPARPPAQQAVNFQRRP